MTPTDLPGGPPSPPAPDGNVSLLYENNLTDFDLSVSLEAHLAITGFLFNLTHTTQIPSSVSVAGERVGGGGGGADDRWFSGGGGGGICTDFHENRTDIWVNCFPLQDPLEMRKPHKANPSFVPIVVTHALTFLLGVSGNSIIVASMARDKGTRNVTR